MSKTKVSFKLKTKLYFISIGMVMLFSAAVLIQFEKGINEQRDATIDGFSLYFENLSSGISQLYYAKYNNVQAFARNSALKDVTKVDEANFVLNELVTLFPDIDYLALVKLDGSVVTTSSIDSTGKKLNVDFLKGHSFKDTKWFQHVSKGKYTENFKKKIFGAYTSDIHVNDIATKMYGSKKSGMHFATLIEDEYGDPIAVLTAFTGVRWIENEINNLYSVLADNGMKSAEVEIISKDGHPISVLRIQDGAKEATLLNDFNFLLKANLFETNNPAIMSMKEGEKGTGVFSDHTGRTEEKLYSYGKIKNQRFLDSMGWGIIISMLPSDAFSEIIALQNMFYMTLAAALIFCVAVSTFIVTKLYKQLIDVIDGLKSSASRTFQFVNQLNGMSNKVNDMSTGQASAIQETASTLDEVSQMVKMSAQNAKNSVDISAKSEKGANHGKEVVLQVVKAMNDIKSSNEEVLNSTSEGNKKISEIVTVINEISEKTKVINDIVFQTKLLSFNASVEAARAGEHGKGFAVVAEEVGNLAQMSGKAAQEISEILDKSVSHVETIVKENQSSIESIMIKSKEKIDEGINVTGECTTALEDIVTDVKVVNNMANEISSASREQESGVSNISEAMNQLQDITNENSNIAYQTLKCSEQLDEETNYLKSVIETLEKEVVGGTHHPNVVNKKQNDKKKVELGKVSHESSHKSSQEASNNNVVELKKHEPEKVSNESNITKSAVGSEIPDSNDPRFEDV